MSGQIFSLQNKNQERKGGPFLGSRAQHQVKQVEQQQQQQPAPNTNTSVVTTSATISSNNPNFGFDRFTNPFKGSDEENHPTLSSTSAATTATTATTVQTEKKDMSSTLRNSFSSLKNILGTQKGPKCGPVSCCGFLILLPLLWIFLGNMTPSPYPLYPNQQPTFPGFGNGNGPWNPHNGPMFPGFPNQGPGQGQWFGSRDDSDWTTQGQGQGQGETCVVETCGLGCEFDQTTCSCVCSKKQNQNANIKNLYSYYTRPTAVASSLPGTRFLPYFMFPIFIIVSLLFCFFVCRSCSSSKPYCYNDRECRKSRYDRDCD